MIVDLVDYRDLFTADRVPADLRPWGGATASAVAECLLVVTETRHRPFLPKCCSRCWPRPCTWCRSSVLMLSS